MTDMRAPEPTKAVACRGDVINIRRAQHAFYVIWFVLMTKLPVLNHFLSLTYASSSQSCQWLTWHAPKLNRDAACHGDELNNEVTDF